MAPLSDPPRPPLTDEERLWLTDKEALAKAAALGPVVLRDRTVEELEITGQSFAAVTWDGVDFLATRFTGTTIAEAHLRDVTFAGCKLEDVGWSRCRFDKCELESVDLDRVRVTDSTGDGLAFSCCECVETSFVNCEFRAFTDDSGAFTRARWQQLRLVEPSLRGTRFREAQVEDVAITGGTLSGVAFSNGQGRGLLLQGTLVDGLDFTFGTWAALTCDGIRGRTLRLTDVQATGVSLLGCGPLVAVAIAGGAVAGLAVDRCPMLGLFSLAKLQVRALEVSQSFIDGAAWHDCTFADDSRITQAKLAGLNLSGSTLDGVVIRDTEFAVWLGLEATRISGLVLDRIRYTPGLDLRADGVDYGPGARFPLTSP
jgi:uncharacterized protein YjbI with pentapeptide repeats